MPTKKYFLAMMELLMMMMTRRGGGGGSVDVDQGDFRSARQQTLMVFKSGGSALLPTVKIGCRMMHYGTLCPDIQDIDINAT